MRPVWLSAADASGDAHAAELCLALRQQLPGARLLGLGGDRMEKAGVELVVHQRELAVGGLVELLPAAPRAWRAWRRLGAALEAARPGLAVLVDASGLNLPFARRLRRRGVACLYYVPPQVWAWRRGRIRRLARRVDRVAAIWPFELPLYREAGVPVDFVGHPLVDRLRAAPGRREARARLKLPDEARLVALLPGSRRNELRYNLGLFLETARRLHAADPRLGFALPVPGSLDPEAVARGIARAGLPATLPLRRCDGRSIEVLAACDAALAKPGTATLEAALLGRPLVVAARAHAVTAALLRRLVEVDWLAMPNLICGEAVVPELLQGDAVPERIARALLERLDGPLRERQLERFASLARRLGGGGAAERAAAIALEMLGEVGAA